MPCWTWYAHPDTIINIFNQNIDRKQYELVFNMTWVPQRVPIHIARNKILAEFMKSGCDYLWFCDDDNPPLLDTLQKLLDSKKDIVSAIVPLRMYDKEWQALNIFYKTMNWYNKNYDHIPKSDDLTYEISNCWTGCVLIHKRVCFDMWKKYKERAFWFTTDYLVNNKIIDVVEVYKDQDKQEWRESIYNWNEEWISKVPIDVSEDLNFFNRCKDLGYKIYARLDTECYHYNWMPSKRILKSK